MDNPRYAFIRRLGSGNFGTVYLAQDLINDTPVAIKVIKPITKDYSDKIMAEIKIMAALSADPSITGIGRYYDAFKLKWDATYIAIVMEYIDGINMYDYIKMINHTLPSTAPIKLNYGRLVYIMYQLIRAVAHIHRNGYAHRDIKPANIIINDDSRVTLVDWGLSCLQSGICRNHPCPAKCGGYPGSPVYMPPEILKHDNRPLDAPAGIDAGKSHDVWSLGITFYELANLNRPFITSGNRDVIYRDIKNTPIQSPYQASSRAPENDFVNTFIRYILNTNPDHRPPIHTLVDHITWEYHGCMIGNRIYYRSNIYDYLYLNDYVASAGSDSFQSLRDLCAKAQLIYDSTIDSSNSINKNVILGDYWVGGNNVYPSTDSALPNVR